MNERCTLARERERKSEREYEEEMIDSAVKKGRFQGGEGRQARRASQGEVQGTMSG